MNRKHSLLFTLGVAAWIGAVGLVVTQAHNDDAPPPAGKVAFAQKVSDLMLNELVAALFTEFDETTPQNVEHGKQAISLIFNDLNRDMRLIGAYPPLLGGANDRPSDRFERTALRRALENDTYDDVVKVNDRWYYRRSVPLSNTLHQACVLCHTNFTDDFFTRTNNPDQWVGSLVLAVPIRPSRSH